MSNRQSRLRSLHRNADDLPCGIARQLLANLHLFNLARSRDVVVRIAAATENPMKHIRTTTARGKMFKPLLASRDVQAAMMTLRPGKATGEIQDEHRKAEQWLFVISGSGV